MSVYLLGSEAEYRKSKAISQSEALIYEQEPILFYKHKILGTEKIFKTSSGFKLGTAIELAFQEGLDVYEETYEVIPDDVNVPSTDLEIAFCNHMLEGISDPTEAMSLAGYSRIGEKSAENLIGKFSSFLNHKKNISVNSKGELTTEEDAIVRRAFDSLWAHPRIRAIYENCEIFSQIPIIYKKEDFKLKALVDNLAIDYKNKIIYNIDLKTTIKPIHTFPKWYRTYDYGFQQVWYRYLIQRVLKEEPSIISNKDISDFLVASICIAVETGTENPISRIFSPSDKYEKQQLERMKRIVKNIYRAIKEGYWKTGFEERDNNYIVPIHSYYE